MTGCGALAPPLAGPRAMARGCCAAWCAASSPAAAAAATLHILSGLIFSSSPSEARIRNSSSAGPQRRHPGAAPRCRDGATSRHTRDTCPSPRGWPIEGRQIRGCRTAVVRTRRPAVPASGLMHLQNLLQQSCACSSGTAQYCRSGRPLVSDQSCSATWEAECIGTESGRPHTAGACRYRLCSAGLEMSLWRRRAPAESVCQLNSGSLEYPTPR